MESRRQAAQNATEDEQTRDLVNVNGGVHEAATPVEEADGLAIY